jgi:hypothetical protein
MKTVDEYIASDKWYREYARAAARAAEARGKLPAGSSRARVTSANARWARAAEARDGRERELREKWQAEASKEER